MKRTTVFLLPFLVFGCAVAAYEEPTEQTTEETQGLDGTEVSAVPAAETPMLGVTSLEGQTTQLSEPGRPDPDPWLQPSSDDDPNRPDPDPWGTPASSKSSSGAKE